MNKIDLNRLDLNLLVTFEVVMSEGSVTRAAARLGRTQSAVSHSLARLREQLGDPLLVKVGHALVPSPYAQTLVEDVRRILRSIQRVLARPESFDPAASTRVFRVAIADFVPTLLPRVVSEVQRLAPSASIEWLAPGVQTMRAVLDGDVDITLAVSSAAAPDGVQRSPAGELHSLTFARKGHPAIASWGAAAWAKWPHVQVQLGSRAKSEVDVAAERHGLARTIGASVPSFFHVPALLARTNLLATMTPLAMEGALDRFGLCALEPPIRIKPTPFYFAWSFRLANDPGSRWLRALVMAAYAELQKSVEKQTSGHLVEVRRRRR